MTVFADTSALYALIDKDDASHSVAAKAWAGFLSGSVSLITNNYVLLETSVLLQSRLGVAALRDFHNDVAPLLAVDWVSAPNHQSGVEAVLAAQRRKLSLVDCISFQTMRERGVTDVFCFDRHFQEQGFRVVP